MDDNTREYFADILKYRGNRVSELKKDIYRILRIRATAMIVLFSYAAAFVALAREVNPSTENTPDMYFVYFLIAILYVFGLIAIFFKYFVSRTASAINHVKRANKILQSNADMISRVYLYSNEEDIAIQSQILRNEEQRMKSTLDILYEDTLIGGSAIVGIMIIPFYVLTLSPRVLVYTVSIASLIVFISSINTDRRGTELAVSWTSFMVLMASVIQLIVFEITTELPRSIYVISFLMATVVIYILFHLFRQ